MHLRRALAALFWPAIFPGRWRLPIGWWHSSRGWKRVMRLLALSGQRCAALAQYEICRRALWDELHVETAVETRRLYNAIRAGELAEPHSWRVLTD